MQTLQELNTKLATAYTEYKKDPVNLREELRIYYRWWLQMAFVAIDEFLREHDYEKRQN